MSVNLLPILLRKWQRKRNNYQQFFINPFVSLINSFLLTKRKYAMGLFKEKPPKEKNEINNKTLKENIANIALAQYRVII